MGVGDNMSGIAWVMEWTSVLVIILTAQFKKKKNEKNSQTKHRKTKEGEPQQKITVQNKLFHFINRSEIKTN